VKRLLLLLSIQGFLGACTHSLHVAQISDFGPSYKAYQNGQLIESRAEQKTILGFVFETNFVDQAYASLQSQCPNGHIQGISSQFSTDHSFLSWTNRVDMKGLCVRR
jgi:hypothetical protein